MVSISVAFPVSAQGPLIGIEAEGLMEVGSWLAEWLGAYSLGKTVDPYIDKILGRDNEKKLQAMENRLQSQLNKGTVDRKQVETELAVAKKELQILRQAMAGLTSQKQAAKYREDLTSDLKVIRATLAEHERRLAEHERILAEQGKVIENQGKIIEDQGHELDALKKHFDQDQPATPPRREPAYPRGYRPTGATLTLEVRGSGNLIRLREAMHPVLMGTFSFTRDRSKAEYFLPREAHAVIELFGPNNRIYMSANLARQLQILSHGFYYQTLIY
jgi:hypothetical protein